SPPQALARSAPHPPCRPPGTPTPARNVRPAAPAEAPSSPPRRSPQTAARAESPPARSRSPRSRRPALIRARRVSRRDVAGPLELLAQKLGHQPDLQPTRQLRGVDKVTDRTVAQPQPRTVAVPLDDRHKAQLRENARDFVQSGAPFKVRH